MLETHNALQYSLYCSAILFLEKVAYSVISLFPRGMTPLEILYACSEIKGNQDRNHWKSGNQASRQKSQFVTKSFLKYM